MRFAPPLLLTAVCLALAAPLRAVLTFEPRQSFTIEDVNPAESPLAWLSRRKDKGGAAMIGEAEFQAGERLRADFWFAGLTPRVTTTTDAHSSRLRT